MRPCQTLVYADLVVTQDKERRILENAGMAVVDGLVADLGPRHEIAARWQALHEVDCGRSLLLPGLINAHTHSAMTFLRGLADDMPLMDWLNKRIFPVEQKLTPEIVRLGSLMGYAEMLRTGTTSCVDMYIFEKEAMTAAGEAGLRCLGGEVVFAFPSAAFAGNASASMP